jgi:hypothetical protein
MWRQNKVSRHQAAAARKVWFNASLSTACLALCRGVHSWQTGCEIVLSSGSNNQFASILAIVAWA